MERQKVSKVLQTTKDLKIFLTHKKLNVAETKETLCRVLDYIDVHYGEDRRDAPFQDGFNGFGLYGKGVRKPSRKPCRRARTSSIRIMR